jgi:hypothetical protein
VSNDEAVEFAAACIAKKASPAGFSSGQLLPRMPCGARQKMKARHCRHSDRIGER